MTLIITWKFEKNFVVGIFGVWIFGLLQLPAVLVPLTMVVDVIGGTQLDAAMVVLEAAA